MNRKEVLKDAVRTVGQTPVNIEFEVEKEVPPRFKWLGARPKVQKQTFTYKLKPLSANQVQQMAAILLDVEVKPEINADGCLEIVALKYEDLIQAVAIALTPSRDQPSAQLLDILRHDVSIDELENIATVISKMMNVAGFMRCIIFLKSLHILGEKDASASDV